MQLSELTPGDRFLAVLNGEKTLWTFIDYDDLGKPICRRHRTKHPGSHESVCYFEKDQIVEFVPPELP
jgi:hypothetical protein